MALVRGCKSIYYTRQKGWDEFNLVNSDGETIFHYSIRPDQGRIVLNKTVNKKWTAEVALVLPALSDAYSIWTTTVVEQNVFLTVNGVVIHSGALDVPLSEKYSITSSMRYQEFAHTAEAPNKTVFQMQDISNQSLVGVICAAPPVGEEVSITIGDQLFQGALKLTDRPDIGITPGEGRIAQGFSVALDADARLAIENSRTRLEVATPVILELKDTGKAQGLINPPGVVEGLGGFGVRGWLKIQGGVASNLELRVGGTRVDTVPSLGGERRFAEDSVLSSRTEAGARPVQYRDFEVILPPSIWQMGDGKSDMEIGLFCDGIELPNGIQTLSHLAAASWVEKMMTKADPAAQTLILGHLTTGNLWPLLSEATAAALKKISDIDQKQSKGLTSEAASVPAVEEETTLIEVLRLKITPEITYDLALNLDKSSEDIPFHLRARRGGPLIWNNLVRTKWQAERFIGQLPGEFELLLVDVELGGGKIAISVNGDVWATLPSSEFDFESLSVRGAHSRFIRRRRPHADVPASGTWAGTSSVLSNGILSGWVETAAPPASLELRVGKDAVSLQPRWTKLETAPGKPSAYQFKVQLPEKMAPRLGAVLSAPSSSKRAAPKVRLTAEGHDIRIVPPVAAIVSDIDTFTLRGRAPGESDSPPKIEVQAGDKTVDIEPIWWELPAKIDPDGAASEEASRRVVYEFEVELPGTLWVGQTDEAELPLKVLIDGVIVEPHGLVLSRKNVLRHFSRIAKSAAVTPDDQAAALLAVEHVALGKFMPELAREEAAFFTRFATSMQLEHLLLGSPTDESLPVPVVPVGEENKDRIIAWRAMQGLNRRLTRDDEPLLPHIQFMVEEWGLSGPRLEEFCSQLLPELCRRGELQQLSGIIPLWTFFHLENYTDAASLSTAAAVLVAEGQVQRAADALYKIANKYAGWLNTTCLYYGLQRVERLATNGTLPEEQANNFRYAILNVINCLKGGWYSRLHDRYMVETMVMLLERRHLMPDYLARDVTRAALQNYTLSPTFWQHRRRFGDQNVSEFDTVLKRAEEYFDRLTDAIGTPERIDSEVASIHEALRFFASINNPEAVFWMREVAGHLLRAGSGASAPEVVKLVKGLVEKDADDVLRVAAHPSMSHTGGLETLQELYSPIPNILYRLRGQPRNSGAHTQVSARKLIATGDKDGSRLLRAADALATGRCSYLGIEVLAMIASSSESGQIKSADAALARLEQAFLRYLAENSSNARHLPAPFLAALSRLNGQRHQRNDTYFTETLHSLNTAVRKRFGDWHDSALADVAEPKIDLDRKKLDGDVIVAIYSCRPLLETRVAAIKNSWMKDLAALGIRYVIVVGDGEGKLNGNVLELDAPDVYDALPKKTVALVDWVVKNTNARYLIKVDDDCYLSAANFFSTMEYRAHHYYGRLLQRDVGNMDRTWHHKKSPDEIKRIDRSPEPSRYADGGGGYCLSRFAMARLTAAARSREGQRILSRSFMEDKLVGDLLSMSGINVSNTDYESYQRRRTFATARPVGRWEDTFFPSRLGTAKIVHLDREADQPLVSELRDKLELHPKKLWPTFKSISLGQDEAQLELLSSPETVARAEAEPASVLCVVRNEIVMLPHFLKHYRALGVRSFFFVDNLSDDGSREYLLGQPDVVLYSTWQSYRLSHYGVTWQMAVLGHHFLGRWAIVADADEFLIYPKWKEKPVQTVIQAMEGEGADAAPLNMIDMYPFGKLEDVDLTSQSPFKGAPWHDRDPIETNRTGMCYYSNRPQQVSALRHRLFPGSAPNSFVAEKIAIFKYFSWIRMSEGLHSATNVKLSGQKMAFAHFKYHGGFRKKVLEEIARKQHFNDAAEYRRYASILMESSGGFGTEDISVKLGHDGFIGSNARTEEPVD